MKENQFTEKKSLKMVTGRTANWKELAKDCVCFANSRGGVINIGIENNDDLPLINQKIDVDLPSKIQKQIAQNSINVAIKVIIKTAENGGQYIELEILPNNSTIASTTDGKYYYRSFDSCVPVLPDEISRLFTDKNSFNWEIQKRKVPVLEIDKIKFLNFKKDIQNSTRATINVKQKSDDELLEHYFFAEDGFLTNLGVLWLGTRKDRAKLSYSPTIHFLKFDEIGQKVNKILWEDYSLNPKELIEAVWNQIPDWREGIDVSYGMFRKFVPNYEEEVIRELIANALVHRPYTVGGDIFIHLYHDRLEVINPGLFPIGITENNVLHKNFRRNPHLAQVFFDLHLMDKEGSGIDKIYQKLLSSGKQIPIIHQGDDLVKFTIKKHILKNEVISLIERANEQFQLSSKELISLGLIAQNNSISASNFVKELNLLNQSNALNHWLGRLINFNLIITKGKTKGTEYLVNSEFLKKANFKGKTNLKRIENHRLEELIYQDIKIYQPTTFGNIHKRIGEELPANKVRKAIKQMVLKKVLISKGKNRYCNYSISI